jgi:hypothetical protein
LDFWFGECDPGVMTNLPDGPTGDATVAAVAATYFDAWRTKDFDRLRTVLADDVRFVGPMATADGADDCLAGLRGLGQIITDIVIDHVFVDGSDVVTWFELHTTEAPPLTVANRSRVEDGRIVAIRVLFDPRPLLPPDAS